MILTSSFCPGSHHPFKNSMLASTNDNESYRSIADVVGGLHGGKYQFGPGSSSFDQPNFSGTGSRRGINNPDDEEPEEIPNWVTRMKPLDTDDFHNNADIVSVQSNANKMDGMVHATTVVIQNQERTWEPFYAKVMIRQESGDFVEVERGYQLSVKPRFTHLAPRGGASNACDANKPYSDSVELKVFHQGNNVDSSTDCWLVAGTEEEKHYYRIEILQ